MHYPVNSRPIENIEYQIGGFRKVLYFCMKPHCFLFFTANRQVRIEIHIKHLEIVMMLSFDCCLPLFTCFRFSLSKIDIYSLASFLNLALIFSRACCVLSFHKNYFNRGLAFGMKVL
ncbi:hypothetical protein BY458DRAFT_516158 [Sporodiniella umbellata]|nr:hypothetical protein BY458DRAFT_516158 [Sporodiniella umbellata]